MEETIKALLGESKGIWAADASPSTIEKRFKDAGIEYSQEKLLEFRKILFAVEGIGEFISGVILHDLTIKRSDFLELLGKEGILPGIKVDKGTIEMANFPGEKITQGLDDLGERLVEYKKMGAKFAKWRAVFTIGENTPTMACINSNSEMLARYGALCQEAEIVPIVEPEVLMEGGHNIIKSEEVTTLVLQTVFNYLDIHKVALNRMLLKPNFVHPGKEGQEESESKFIADATLRTLRNCIPASVPGILFLSGGDNPEGITKHLNDLNKLGDNPWKLAFSFERALEGPAMEVWAGRDENIQVAQEELYKRAKLNSLALQGKYSEDMEKAA